MKKVFATLMVALFATVVFGETTKTEIKPSEMPVCIQKNISQSFAGFSIEKVYRIITKLEQTYEVSLIKGKERMIISYDEKCKVIKKIIPNQKKKEDPKPVPPTPKPNPQTTPAKPAPLPPKK